MNQQNEPNKKDFKRIFNMNNILSQVITFSAYIILIGSILILSYLSFVEKFDFNLDWRTIGIFSGTTMLLSWSCWNMFYRKQKEKIMGEDILQQEHGKYSIHSRYYTASKDWTDAELQIAIDNFNNEYTEKWVRWVEKSTGVPIESSRVVEIDPTTQAETILEIKGMKDLSYRGFKHKILMWRIKNHKYPESGYKTSMELLSLLSYQDSNFNKRNLRADRQWYIRKSISKLITSGLILTMGASLLPEMIDGEWWSTILKLCLAIGTLISSTFMGAICGVQGARKKLSIVEDTCTDLERWAGKKPILTPYIESKAIEQKVEKVEVDEQKTEEIQIVTNDIFKAPNILKK